MSSRPVRDTFSIKKRKATPTVIVPTYTHPYMKKREGKKSMPAIYKSGVRVHSCNTIERLKKEDQEFEAILDYTTRPCLLVKKKKTRGEGCPN